MRTPEKFPPLPVGVNPFEWIVLTAAALRRRQAHEIDILLSRRQADREREAAALRAREEVESIPGRKPAG